MSAVFSPCRTWRYTLMRAVDEPGCNTKLATVAFIALNPSTADETTDDPTVRRCTGFAKRWGYDRMVLLNVFALRSTNPGRLRGAADPVGPENDDHLVREAARADLVVCAWGVHATLGGRAALVEERLRAITPLHALGLTKAGYPRHPLYLRGDLTPEPWDGVRSDGLA